MYHMKIYAMMTENQEFQSKEKVHITQKNAICTFKRCKI